MSIVETTMADAGQPVSGNQAEAIPEVTTEGTQVSQEAPARYTVKVNGVELDVDLDELRNGYMRQADYTRKGQALAAQRQEAEQALALANALKRDPNGTLQALASEFGINEFSVDVDDDPASQRIRDLEARLEQISNLEAKRQVDAEVNDLKSRYDASEAQIEEAASEAVRRGVPLATAYRDLYFDDYLELARQLRSKQTVESEVNAQKQAAAVVHLGTSTAAGATAPAVTKPKSFRESYLLAKQGIRFND